MKKILLLTIDFYQKVLYLFLRNAFGINPVCRFDPTCSNYAKESIAKYGPFKGTKMSLIRILKCQPFYKGSIAEGRINANI